MIRKCANVKKLKEKLFKEILIISCQIDEEQGNALWVATPNIKKLKEKCDIEMKSAKKPLEQQP